MDIRVKKLQYQMCNLINKSSNGVSSHDEYGSIVGCFAIMNPFLSTTTVRGQYGNAVKNEKDNTFYRFYALM